MSDRRPMGSLENEVLGQLWALRAPATATEVLNALGTDLAYNTVQTILTRLWQKGLVDRQPKGRAFAYEPIYTEAELAAERMSETLAAASDRNAALSRFVGGLSGRDAQMLRRLLAEPPRSHKKGKR